MEQYVKILEESLEKKDKVLDDILLLCKEQEGILKEEKPSLEEFDRLVDEKDEQVQKLIDLDNGFETLYEKVKEDLQKDRAKYRTNIGHMQKLIGSITEKSVEIQAIEERNKSSLNSYFSKERKQLRMGRATSKAAYDYYKTMANPGNYRGPQVMDEKQ